MKKVNKASALKKINKNISGALRQRGGVGGVGGASDGHCKTKGFYGFQIHCKQGSKTNPATKAKKLNKLGNF
jgi:hypothetical protein